MERAEPAADSGIWRASFAALCATLVGIGLARFAYTPLLPALIEGGWFSPSEAAYIGAANLAGYLVGALVGGRLAARVSLLTALRAGMVLAALAFFACMTPWSLTWFFLWRLISGIAGGVLMVLAAPAVLPQVPVARRGLAGGLIFTGVGLGIAASGTLVPLLLRLGLVETWLGLGILSLGLTALAWNRWPAAANATLARPAAAPAAQPRTTPVLIALFVAYGLDATGLVPHFVFLVDFVARGLGQGIDAGSGYWVLFGLGAIAGPLLAGALADRVGFGPALRLTFLLQALAVALPAISGAPAALVVSSVVIGASAPGVVPLVLGRVHELLPGDPVGQAGAWRIATIAFSLGQAGGAFAFSWLFARSEGYDLLFLTGAAAFVLALVIEGVVRRHR